MNQQNNLYLKTNTSLEQYKTILLSIFVLWSVSLTAQTNFIFNGDFELHTGCPNGVTMGGNNEINKCDGWRRPTAATSDYYNACNSGPNYNGTVSVPGNILDYQESFNGGNAYVGLYFAAYTGGGGAGGYSGVMWWEYVQGHLSAPLEAGKVYKLSMEISLTRMSGIKLKEFGAYFSPNFFTTQTSEVLNVTPQCVFTNPSYFGDTLNWMHVESLFMATGTENYITIGNFSNEFETDTTGTGFYFAYAPSDPRKAYYFIDDVRLVEAPEGFPDPDNPINPDVPGNEPTTQTLIPNILTPNGDGINDVWKIYLSNPKEINFITIVNRWGEIVAEGDLKGFTWDGKDQTGKECSEGIYFFKTDRTDISGFIQLIR